MQKKKKRIFIIALSFAILYFFTLGVHIELWYDSYCDNPLGEILDIVKHVPNPPYITAYLDGGDYNKYGIPLLFHVSTEEPPYTLNLVFWANDGPEVPDGVVVSYLRIKYDNGKEYTLIQPDNTKKSSAFDSEPDNRSTKSTTAYIQLPDSIKYSSSFIIETKGYLYKGEDTIPFEQTIKLIYDRQGEIAPGWVILFLSWGFGVDVF